MVDEQTPTELSLPMVTRTIARQIHAAGSQVMNASGAMPLMLRNVSFGWRLLLQRQNQKVFFFFFYERQPMTVFLDTQLTMKLDTTPHDAVPHPVDDSAIKWVMTLPAFVYPKFSQSQLRQLLGNDLPNARADTTLIMKVGQHQRDILVCSNPGAGAGGWFSANAEILYLRSTGAPVRGPTDAAWPVLPFIAMVDAVRNWISGKSGEGSTVRYEAAESDALKTILNQLVSGYVTSAAALLASPSIPSPSANLNYVVNGYDAELKLLLDSSGQVADQNADINNCFLLLLSMSIKSQSATPPVAAFSVGVPDFLISGDLFKAFIKELIDKATVRWVAAAHLAAASDGDVAAMISAATDQTSIFRVARLPSKDNEELDTDIVIVPGTIMGHDIVLILEIEVSVDAQQKQVVMTRDANRLFCGDPSEGTLDMHDPCVTYFLRLASCLKSWIGDLG